MPLSRPHVVLVLVLGAAALASAGFPPEAAPSPIASPPAPVQSAGSRGGVNAPAAVVHAAPLPDHFAVEHYITIQGSAELRVVPTEVRVVLALTSDGATAAECHAHSKERVDALRAALQESDAAVEEFLVDFIALLPRYDWQVEERAGQRLAVERVTGYRLQTNVHLRTLSEAAAQGAVGEALALGITDVLAFDYDAAGLDAKKTEAQALALAEAERKAGLLLAGFATPPKRINVHESTRVVPPVDQYRSFGNDYSAAVTMPYRGELPQVAAARPKNTYYHGSGHATDVRPAGLPMQPEVAVVSAVTLYFAAPDRPAPGGSGSPGLRGEHGQGGR